MKILHIHIMPTIFGIEDMHKYALSHGGKCLAEKYESMKTRVEWECAKSHKWFGRFGTMRTSNRWCVKCAGIKKINIEFVHTVAKNKGGKCLSTEYKNQSN